MLVVEIVLAALVVFGVAAVAMGYGGSITHFAPDWPGRSLPEDRTVRADDIAKIRFSLAFRGYRMHEVDATIDKLAVEIATRDARIEQLTGRPFESSDVEYTAPDVSGQPQPYEQQPYEQQPYEPRPYDPSAYGPPSHQPSQSPEPPSSPTYQLPDAHTLADNPFAPPVYRADDAQR